MAKICPKCETKTSDDAKFCFKCGHSFSEGVGSWVLNYGGNVVKRNVLLYYFAFVISFVSWIPFLIPITTRKYKLIKIIENSRGIYKYIVIVISVLALLHFVYSIFYIISCVNKKNENNAIRLVCRVSLFNGVLLHTVILLFMVYEGESVNCVLPITIVCMMIGRFYIGKRLRTIDGELLDNIFGIKKQILLYGFSDLVLGDDPVEKDLNDNAFRDIGSELAFIILMSDAKMTRILIEIITALVVAYVALSQVHRCPICEDVFVGKGYRNVITVESRERICGECADSCYGSDVDFFRD